MSIKSIRRKKILDIIENNIIETQDDLVEKLTFSGMSVTQATVSRDITDMGLIKIPFGQGQYKYAASGVSDEQRHLLQMVEVFENAVVKIDYAQNIVVIKTLAGMAQAAASAIDAMDIPDALGTIAGDDTIMLVAKNVDAAERISKTIS